MINIHGKEYMLVNERVEIFRRDYADWSISTSIEKMEGKYVIVKAVITDDKGVIRSTGHALEVQGNGFINTTSHLENCETSAVGRALGFLGIGIETSIASADEVANAISEQVNSEYQAEIKKEIENLVKFVKDNYELTTKHIGWLNDCLAGKVKYDIVIEGVEKIKQSCLVRGAKNE